MNTVLEHKALCTDGAWRRPSGDEVLEVVDPATEQVTATLPAATAKDVAAGCAVVREPSEAPPLDACLLAGVHGPEEFLRPKALRLPAFTGRTAS